MRDTVSNTPVLDPHVPHTLVHARPQPASPAVINMDDSLNDTKESQRKTDTEDSMLEASSALSDNPEDTTNPQESDPEPMDISGKTTTTVESDQQSNCSSPDGTDTKYFCPICELSLTSQHDFTLHIRSHNNDNDIIPEKGFTCCICSKVLSSSSSLDRHTLVHSGERPFRCKVCQLTFTTNGNMHRHMRTHSHKPPDNYESDGSTDSSSSAHSATKTRKRRLEFNNNKLVDNANKRKSECLGSDHDDNGNHRRKPKNLNNNNSVHEAPAQKYQCPVCDRQDFASLNVLQTHMEDIHPYYEVRCNSCHISFKNYRALNLHRHMVHYNETINNINNKTTKNLHLGFKDLTFVDFSSNKFPHIARYECEKNLHKPVTVQKFICDKCHLAFPCSSALQIHQEECLKAADSSNDPDYPTDLSKTSNMSDEEVCRENFFAHLNLQNKSVPTSPTSVTPEDELERSQKVQREIKPVADTKDLADIQSILSMTSNGSLLQHLRTKPASELLHKPDIGRMVEQPIEEESQDLFAAEFRKMKLRGEFPCRLCTAIFPNLRALKGHNRAHLTGSGNTGPYRCNMCPHSSIDKAALIRHMRTHNGDRPYECSLCNYAFTTKANCERHLRNRHAKVTREEVKKAIIYHPSEDPTNEEINKLASVRTDTKQAFVSNMNDDDSRISDKVVSSVTKECTRPELRNLMLPQTLGILTPNIMSKDLSINLTIPKEPSPSLQIGKELIPPPNNIFQKEEKSPFDYRKSIGLSYQPEIPEKLTEEALIPKIQVKSIDGLKQIPDYDTHSDEEDSSNNMSSSFEDYSKSNDHPMDLSMDVLDLSTKKDTPKLKSDEEAQDFTKKTLESSPTLPQPSAAAQLLLTQQLLKNPNFYLHALSPYCLSNLPHNPYPFLFPPTFMNSPEMKERMLRLQLSGGTMISEQFSPLAANGMQPFHPQTMPNIPDIKYPISKPESELKPPLQISTQLGETIAKIQSPKSQPKSADLSTSPNSVKMVIKNGVLMPKQKQRRYRTERPFSCEHCSARFTLRSNMERHIKQQHPQYWSQRQRAGLTGVGRKPINTLPPSTVQGNSKPQYYDLNIPNYDIPKILDPKETKDKDSNANHNISQQVKYAILAQQLKAHSSDSNYSSSTKEKPAQDEDEDALIIDEENADEKPIKQETKESLNEVKLDSEKLKSLDIKMQELRQFREKEIKLEKTDDEKLLKIKAEEAGQDLVPVSRLLDNAVSSQLPFREYFRREGEDNEGEGVSEEDEEGLVASGSTSEGNGSGSDENKSENESAVKAETVKKKSAYSLAPNRVSCQYCHRKFPWKSSLRRHVLTHTGQKPFKCPQCPLLFTTKSNCDRHLLRKHGNNSNSNTDNTNNNNSNSQNYMMRNVPERPYKCSSCPSSTFATLSNLKKHMSCKHTIPTSGTDQPRSDDLKGNECEGMVSSEDERAHKQNEGKNEWETQIAHSKVSLSSDGVNIQNADLPFKCHLCEGSYAERQEALDHIKEAHVTEYELLMAKGALDQSATGHDEVHTSHETEEDDHLRGRFPDYANRKVMCAFCMRRFWSAEDLRRHMRTHTGERPFSCDVCNRRFTLKHSMLRHRKKHNLSNAHEDNNVVASGDEDPNRASPYDRYSKINNNNSLMGKGADKSSEEDSEGTEGNDLIGNLLGIRDKSIIDQVLISSADDAAKLLGVQRGQE